LGSFLQIKLLWITISPERVKIGQEEKRVINFGSAMIISKITPLDTGNAFDNVLHHLGRGEAARSLLRPYNFLSLHRL
jgi:hypothetical protein